MDVFDVYLLSRTERWNKFEIRMSTPPRHHCLKSESLLCREIKEISQCQGGGRNGNNINSLQTSHTHRGEKVSVMSGQARQVFRSVLRNKAVRQGGGSCRFVRFDGVERKKWEK